VNGKTYAPEIVTGGEVSITDYDGGEITPIVGKLASISMVVDGGDPVTVPGSFVVGQSVELDVDEKEGYTATVKVGDTVITPDENGAYLYTITDEETVVSITYTEIEADGSEGDTDTDTKPGDTDVEDKPEGEGENKDDKKDDSSMVIIVAVIAAVVLIAAVAVIVIFLKKK